MGRSDWLVGLVVVMAILGLNSTTSFFDRLEQRYYDFSSASTGRMPSDKVVVLAIDNASVANIGRWPWPRDVHARMLDLLAQGKVKTVAHTAFFFEPQTDRGVAYLGQIRAAVEKADAADPLVNSVLPIVLKAEQELNTDQALAVSIANNSKVILPGVFQMGPALGRPDAAVPEFVTKHAPGPMAPKFLQAQSAQWPLAMLGEPAATVGHLNQLQSLEDGVVRTEMPFVNYDGHLVPSLALAVAAHSLNLDVRNTRSDAEGELILGGLHIPLDASGVTHPQFYPDVDGHSAFVTDSFFDVYSGKIPVSKYAGKVVLIGATADGIGSRMSTPTSPTTDPVTVLAHVTSSILSGYFFSVPDWAPAAQAAVVALVAAYIMFALPRLAGPLAAVASMLLVMVLLGSEYMLITRQTLWLSMVLPTTVLVLGYLTQVTRRYLLAEAGKVRADEESAETNRMMGLALQGQGQLDMAFDRFRRVPLNDAVMDNLMNLALDFERKRQFNKAQAVYELMVTHNSAYKGLQVRLKRAKNLSETVMLGGGSGHPGGTLLAENGDVAQPMLGRYQIERELGKGAMGVVYLGKDPKIGRVVAIKTLALSQEFEGSELTDARQRFFREAETAGRLQHQNIVTIFDAGEDQDLAYIAMEFLKGKDLVAHTQPGHLLPMATVVSIAARVADALAYAHDLKVVHRDIKPANIMYETQSDSVKVTDFGIARVTDASRTRTGMVLGTPSFMSPEQIAGKKVDGRSDLYSLGVMLFQMLAGVLPFRGESMAELMFKIANEPAPDIRAFRPEVPASLARVMEKAMAKSLEVRYTSGGQLAADLRACMGDIPSGGGHSSALDQVQYPAALTAPMDMTQPMDTEAFATTVMMDDVVDTTMDATGMGQGRGHAS